MLDLIKDDASLQHPLRYDYSQIDAAHRESVMGAAIDIKQRERRAVMDIVEIGRALKEVNERLEHGQFLPWIEQEFGWQRSMAYNFMAVADKFPKFGNLDNYGLSALYTLSGPSVPEEAVAEARQMADSGQKVTHKAARALVDKHKSPTETPAQRSPLAVHPAESVATYLKPPPSPAPAPASYAGAADSLLAPPVAPTLPADLARYGWELRQVSGAGTWWCYNRSGSKATSTYEQPTDAIAEAVALAGKGRGNEPPPPAPEEITLRVRLTGSDTERRALYTWLAGLDAGALTAMAWEWYATNHEGADHA